jgi:hypothetical protein
MSRRSLNLGILIALQAAYFGWLLLFGRFIAGDEILFKAAGRAWAQTGTFMGPELLGVGVWKDPAKPYELRGCFCPPIYSFSFGLFVKTFGFNPTTNAAFDGLIHILLGWAAWSLARALGPQLPYEAAMIAAAATIPLGTAGRPDELGALLALFGSAILVRRVTTRRSIVAGLLFGLSAGTSLVAPLLYVLWVLRAFWRHRREGALPIIAFAVTSAVAFLMVMIPLVLMMPDGLSQLWQQTRASVRPGYRYSLANGWRYGRLHYLACGAAIVVAAAQALEAWRSRGWSRWLDLWMPSLAALVALVILLPVKSYYVWIIDPALFAAAVCAIAMLSWPVVARTAVVVTATLFWCAAAAFPMLMSLVCATLPADQRMAENVRLLYRVIPSGSGVMTYDFWPAVAGSRYQAYSTGADPRWSDVDYIVLTGNGSGTPGLPQTLRPDQLSYVKDHYSPILDHLNRHSFQIGPIHTHSAWGYGPLILKRNDVKR